MQALLMGEEALQRLRTKGLSTKKNETIFNISLQGINIRLQRKMANLGEMNPKQEVVGRSTMIPLHNSPELPVMRSPRQLSNSSKEEGEGTVTCVCVFYGLNTGTQISALSKLYNVPKCYEM